MSLRDRLRRIDEKRRRLLADVEALPGEALAWHPDEESWSVLEIIEHLVLAEQDVFVDLDDLARLTPRPRSWSHVAGYWVVLAILRYRIPVAVPSEGMRPHGSRSLSELRDVWDAQHAKLSAFVASLAPGREKDVLFRHPVTGPMRVIDGIRMLEVHLDRHRGQIDKAVASWKGRPQDEAHDGVHM